MLSILASLFFVKQAYVCLIADCLRLSMRSLQLIYKYLEYAYGINVNSVASQNANHKF